jgi:7-cyano-7-deazaguanine synthase
MGMIGSPQRDGWGATGRGPAGAPLAILVSGGLDSAILLGESLRTHEAVHPLYVRSGLIWEATELRHLERFLSAVATPALRPLRILELPVADLYGDHWSVNGECVPDDGTPDEAVYLPGRNVLLLAKALIWCQLNRVPAVALAVLESNPFPDATPGFFTAYQSAVSQAVGGSVRVFRPYAGLSKAKVMHRGRVFPLGLTFSCIRPVAGLHCGRCNKCAERRRAFDAAGMPDPTEYAAVVQAPPA